MKDLPQEQRRFTEDGVLKHNAVLLDEDVGGWAGLRGSLSEFNTTWHTLQEHGWKGSTGKCITKVYSTHFANKNGRILGYACKPKPIDHPKMSWNGEPCLKASNKKECAEHSEVCDWKPGPKCELRLFHEMQLRCLHCKNFEQNHKLSPGRGKGSYCKQCTKWQLYYSKAKSELACHILQHFHGLGPDITSRIDTIEGYLDDHNKAPNGNMEFTFDGKRTCVKASGGVKHSQQRNGRDSTQKGKPEKDKIAYQIETFHKSREVCQGGAWRRWSWDTRRQTFELQGSQEGFQNKRKIEVSGDANVQGPWVFERCGYLTEASAYWKHLNEANFYETLEALAEAIKHGGMHPECPAPDRAMPDDPPVTKEAAEELNAWAKDKPCQGVDVTNRRDVSTESGSEPTIPSQGNSFAGQTCRRAKRAQWSKENCESLYEVTDGWKAPCVWVPNNSPSPYGMRCFRCDEIQKFGTKKRLESCGPDDRDAPKKCHADCVIPASWSSQQSFTQFSPCSKFLSSWGFCGCADVVQQGHKLKPIDCRGCSDEAVKKMMGKPCAEVAPDISPALCLALQALGVDDAQIGQISVRPHWAHGAQYYFGERATCLAAGQPWLSCAGTHLFPKTSAKEDPLRTDLHSRAVLYCAGGESVINPGRTKEESFTMGNSYGSIAAQAKQLVAAIKRGGEHPACPVATATLARKTPCLRKPPPTDFRTWPGNWSDTWWHTPYTETECNEKFRHAFPATLKGPDSSNLPYSPFVQNEALHCGNAGYPMAPIASVWGPDRDDKKYNYQDFMLFHTEVFGRGICSEHRKVQCGDFKLKRDSGPVSIPGCRRDMTPKTSCSSGNRPKGKGYECVCEDTVKKPTEPNTMSHGVGIQLGGNSCSKEEMKEGVFECFGPLAKLKPGSDNRFGFRCKADEAIDKAWAMTTFHGEKNGYSTSKGFGRFTEGSSSTPTCVRQHVRCNGACNCKDCSDEKGCGSLPTLVG
jgi:hypothetical protein